MLDCITHIRGDVFRVGDARACPSVGVTVVCGAKVSVVGKGRKVCGFAGDVTVKGAGIEFGGGGECFVYGRHQGCGYGPVVSEVEFASLGVDCIRAGVVALE